MEDDPESPAQLSDVHLPYERLLVRRRSFLGKEIEAASVNSRKSVANAGVRERIVPDTADHVFRLP